MNLFNIIQEVEKVDPEINDRLNPRRAAIKNITSFGSKVAVAALPFALGAMFKKAYGETPNSVVDVLNYALTLEHLEYRFYATGHTQGPVTSGPDKQSIVTICTHEAEHVSFLTNVIKSSGGTPVAEAKYDFTAGGLFPNVFNDLATFLAVAQVFEDTGVRAYKGQAANLLGNKVVLTAALNIHSVEARHAAHIREMRKSHGFIDVKPWITGANDSGVPAANGNYAGEDNDTQAGVKITHINGFNDIDVAAATESFDEPLDKQTVINLVAPFFKK